MSSMIKKPLGGERRGDQYPQLRHPFQGYIGSALVSISGVWMAAWWNKNFLGPVKIFRSAVSATAETGLGRHLGNTGSWGLSALGAPRSSGRVFPPCWAASGGRETTAGGFCLAMIIH